jgi:hypothetical protein
MKTEIYNLKLIYNINLIELVNFMIIYSIKIRLSEKALLPVNLYFINYK